MVVNSSADSRRKYRKVPFAVFQDENVQGSKKFRKRSKTLPIESVRIEKVVEGLIQRELKRREDEKNLVVVE